MARKPSSPGIFGARDAGLFWECETDKFGADSMGVTAPLVFRGVSVCQHRRAPLTYLRFLGFGPRF